MYPALQPHRPQPHPHTLHNQNPLYQQQVRSQINPPTNQALHPPRSQIEAMPPFAQTFLHPSANPQLSHPSFHNPAALQHFLQRPVYDPAKCHPVFFTQSLRRPPFSFADSGGSGANNPVAFGYVAEQVGGGVKGTKL